MSTHMPINTKTMYTNTDVQPGHTMDHSFTLSWTSKITNTCTFLIRTKVNNYISDFHGMHYFMKEEDCLTSKMMIPFA